MPRNSHDLSATEKVKVALDCLHRELLGDPNASKTVAQKYDLSTRAVTTLKHQALDLLQQGFSAAASAAATSAAAINDHTLDQALNALLSTASTSAGQPEVPASDRAEAVGITLDQVFAAIVAYNKLKKEPPIYVSQGILQKLSAQSVAEVKLWFAQHESEVSGHNAKYDLTPITNRRIKRDFKYKEALGLGDET